MVEGEGRFTRETRAPRFRYGRFSYKSDFRPCPCPCPAWFFVSGWLHTVQGASRTGTKVRRRQEKEEGDTTTCTSSSPAESSSSSVVLLWHGCKIVEGWRRLGL